MPHRGIFSRAARGWRSVAALLATIAVIAGHLAWDAERRNAGLRNDMAQMRGRLVEKRDVIVRQRQEMATVSMAVEHLARTTTALGERATRARRVAHMEETRDQTVDLLTIPASFDGGMS